MLGQINFQAPDEVVLMQYLQEHLYEQYLKVILVQVSNATTLEFMTGASEAPTRRMKFHLLVKQQSQQVVF